MQASGHAGVLHDAGMLNLYISKRVAIVSDDSLQSVERSLLISFPMREFFTAHCQQRKKLLLREKGMEKYYQKRKDKEENFLARGK